MPLTFYCEHYFFNKIKNHIDYRLCFLCTYVVQIFAFKQGHIALQVILF